MNQTMFELNWKKIRGQVNTRWTLMGESDLKKVDKADSKFSKFVTLLQVKYGYSRPVAKVQVNRLWAEYEARQKSIA